MQTSEGNVTIDFFVDIEHARDSLVVGRMQAKRPAVLGEEPDNGLQFRFHNGRHVRARFEKVLEIRGRVNQHFAGTVHSVKVVACAGLRQLRPLRKIRQLALGLLRE